MVKPYGSFRRLSVNGGCICGPAFISHSSGQRIHVCLKLSLLLLVLLLLWLQLYFTRLVNSKDGKKYFFDEVSMNSINVITEVPSVVQRYYLTLKPSNASVKNNPKRGVSDVFEIQQNIQKYNEMQRVLNQNQFGPLNNGSLVIVIQVHTRIMYLRYLIESLAQAKGIENVLLIFSHDYYDDEINDLVQSISFCKVIQIFYPYSIQTHVDRFPGDSPGDCPKNISRKHALALNCNNALHPDAYGRYREAKVTQLKHHWWWKLNRVFNGLEITRNYTGLVLFLEEDHYVAADFIHILRLMEKTAHVSCLQCNIFSLGNHLTHQFFYGNPQMVDRTSAFSNLGMAFNRSVWQEIYSCAKTFCTYDDYNWDWSLQYVSEKCLQHNLEALTMRSPRAFHIGECGFHHKNSCKSDLIISKIKRILQAASEHLYPRNITVEYIGMAKQPLTKGFGGWGDIRDHHLCLNITRSGDSL